MAETKESWEDADVNMTEAAPAAPAAPAAKPFTFNPNASTFTFNPSAAGFVPKPAAPAPAPAAPAAASPAPPASPAPSASASPMEEVTEKMKDAAVDKKKVETKKKKDEEELAALEKEEAEKEDLREHVNIVFIGHVDAGKSTIGGQILFLTGAVDDRLIQKYEREAKEKNRESWYMAYIMDTNEEERAKGKTVEVGRAHFETAKKRYTILDAPGHKNYVPNMIAGAAQADVGVLVISSRKGEFETGFERGGQTREHAQLAKTLGVAKLIVVVNKMDDPSVEWDKGRFDEVETKLTPFLKQCGYNTKKDVFFLPISGLHGHGMKDRVPKDKCPWFDGPSLFETLDGLEPQDRDATAPFRMPIMSKYKEDGKTFVLGKTEAGTVRRGDTLMVMPNKTQVKVTGLFQESDEMATARPGENIRVRVMGVEEEDVSAGFVLCSVQNPIPVVTEFDALLSILELLEHKSIFTAGYKCVLHIHSITEECEVIDLHYQIDPKTKQPIKKKCLFLKSGSIALVRIQMANTVCIERFKDFPQLGRFTLRDEGRTIAIGKVEKLRGVPKPGDAAAKGA